MQHSIFLCTREFLDIYVKEKKQTFQLSPLFVSFPQTLLLFSFYFLQK